MNAFRQTFFMLLVNIMSNTDIISVYGTDTQVVFSAQGQLLKNDKRSGASYQTYIMEFHY